MTRASAGADCFRHAGYMPDWCTGEPNNAGLGNEDCTFQWKNASVCLYDKPCDDGTSAQVTCQKRFAPTNFQLGICGIHGLF